jgi:cytochrome b6-f complex iron-sulfur subunit
VVKQKQNLCFLYLSNIAMKTPPPQKTKQTVAEQVVQVAQMNQQAVESNASRRRFLQGAAGVAGGLALGLQLVAVADETDGATPVTATPAAETLVPIPEKVLAKVGGADVVEAAGDKIMVVRTGPSSVSACSAICTHKGCTVGYEEGSKELVCPCHGARYSLDGKVKQGPAKRSLKPYNARLALGLSEKAGL